MPETDCPQQRKFCRISLIYKSTVQLHHETSIGDSGNIIYASKETNISVGITGTFKPRIFDRVEFIEKMIVPVIEG